MEDKDKRQWPLRVTSVQDAVLAWALNNKQRLEEEGGGIEKDKEEVVITIPNRPSFLEEKVVIPHQGPQKQKLLKEVLDELIDREAASQDEGGFYVIERRVDPPQTK